MLLWFFAAKSYAAGRKELNGDSIIKVNQVSFAYRASTVEGADVTALYAKLT